MDATQVKFPTEKEIAEAEKRLQDMKLAREAAKNQVMAAIKSNDFLNSLSSQDTISLMKMLQARVRGTHKKTRGSPVPEDLKQSLIKALTSKERYTLSQLEEMFNLSISYISRIKRELRDAGRIKDGSGPVMNAYEGSNIHQMEASVG